MQQELTTTSSSSKITMREVEGKIAALHGRLEPHPVHPTRYCVRRDMAATTIEQRQLTAVRKRLEQELAPCTNRAHVEGVVNRMLMGFDFGHGPSDENTEGLNNEFVDACKGLPLSAIITAAERIRTATTLRPYDPTYRPTPGLFAAEVREGMIPIRVKLLHLSRVLDAEVYDPPTQEQQDAVKEAAAEYARTRAKLGPDGEPRPQPSEEEISAAREAVIRDGADRLKQIAGAESGRGLNHLMARLDAKRGIQNAGASA